MKSYDHIECPRCDKVSPYRELQKEEHPFRSPQFAGAREWIYGCPHCDSCIEDEDLRWVEKDD